MERPSFNLLGELKIIYVRIPLLKALHDVPIYAKTITDLVVKKPGRKLLQLQHFPKCFEKFWTLL